MRRLNRREVALSNSFSTLFLASDRDPLPLLIRRDPDEENEVKGDKDDEEDEEEDEEEDKREGERGGSEKERGMFAECLKIL